MYTYLVEVASLSVKPLFGFIFKEQWNSSVRDT